MQKIHGISCLNPHGTDNNNTQLLYDPLGRCVKITETTAGSVTSTKQFVWCGNERCEERDGSGSLSNGKQFYGLGQVNYASGTPTNFFYNLDHLGSVREMTKTVTGTTTIEAQYDYSPWGEVTKLQGSADSDFQYARYYKHARSGLNLTLYRAYNPGLGRWISRDPLGEEGEDDSDDDGTVSNLNLYSFCNNSPVNFLDLDGLLPGFLGGRPPGAPGGGGKQNNNWWRPPGEGAKDPNRGKPKGSSKCNPGDPERAKGKRPRVSNNTQQNQMAKSALREVARERGMKKITESLRSEFHQRITGQGHQSFQELKGEAREFLDEKFGIP